jgi:hypothetical protein
MTSSSGLRGRRRTYRTIFKRAWSADSKINGKVSSPVTSEAGARCHSKINVRVRLWESRSTPTLRSTGHHMHERIFAGSMTSRFGIAVVGTNDTSVTRLTFLNKQPHKNL